MVVYGANVQLRKEKRELEETLESEQLSQVQHLQKKILKLESEVVRKQEALIEVRIETVSSLRIAVGNPYNLFL